MRISDRNCTASRQPPWRAFSKETKLSTFHPHVMCRASQLSCGMALAYPFIYGTWAAICARSWAGQGCRAMDRWDTGSDLMELTAQTDRPTIKKETKIKWLKKKKKRKKKLNDWTCDKVACLEDKPHLKLWFKVKTTQTDMLATRHTAYPRAAASCNSHVLGENTF